MLAIIFLSLSLLWHLRFRYEHILHLDNAFISFCHRNLFQTRASEREREKELLFGAMMDLPRGQIVLSRRAQTKCNFTFYPKILISYCKENLYTFARGPEAICYICFLYSSFEASVICSHESESPAALLNKKQMRAAAEMRNPPWCRSIEMLQQPLLEIDLL